MSLGKREFSPIKYFSQSWETIVDFPKPSGAIKADAIFDEHKNSSIFFPQICG